jgi:hypothetical protein
MIENWYPTSIYYYDNIETPQEISDELRAVEKQIENLYQVNSWNDNVSSTYGSIGNVILKYNLIKFNNFINIHVKNYIEEIKTIPTKFYIEDSWFNRINKFGYQDKHLHNYSTISGCYYFENTNLEDEGITFYTRDYFGREKIIYYPYINNRLMLFPGLLEHSVKYKKTEGVRKSISFNFKLEY